MITLKTDRLRVEIAEPAEAPNTGFRFDRAGFISEVVLDGAHHFCTSEPLNLVHPSSGGRGLCCEYQCDLSGEAEEGEYYPKFGIGLIRKEGPYVFHKQYADLKPFPVQVSVQGNEVSFVTEPIACMGYAVLGKKTVTVEGETVTVRAQLENVGSKELTIKEYCHNFLSPAGMAISPDYQFLFPTAGIAEGETVEVQNNYPGPVNYELTKEGVSILRCETQVSLIDIPKEKIALGNPFVWTLRHKSTGLSVKCEDHVDVAGITLWETDHVFSPEIAQEFTIKPGETHSWSRSMTFVRE